MSYLRMSTTTNVPKLVRRAKIKARLGGASTSLDFISSDQTTVYAEVADLVNDAVREVLDDFPILSIVSEATLTVPLGGTSSPLPVDLRHNDILKVWYDTPEGHQRPLVQITQLETESMDSLYKLPRIGQDYPFWYYIVGNSLHILPETSSEVTLHMKYRAKQSQATPADITKPENDPTATIVPVVDEMIELVALGLAKRFSDINSGADSANSGALYVAYENLRNKFMNDLTSSFDQTQNNAFDFHGVPKSRYGRDYDGFSSGLAPISEDYF